MRKSVLLFMAVLLALPMSFLIAGTLKGITMPDTIMVEDQTLVLNGMALRKKFIFKVYVAGLYLPQKESDAEKILKGFSSKIKESKIWGPSSKFPGQQVGLQHELKDLDIVEFKTR